MIRAFTEHFVRQTQTLEGHWDFVADPGNIGLRDKWFERFPEGHRPMYVPGCWNNELGLYEYEGVAWYRTRFRNAGKRHIRLIFHAVLGHADVYLDGRHLGYHYGGYTPFEFVTAGLDAGEHELVVRTDSTLDALTIPTHVVDWFHYGGIIRPVELQTLPDIYIEKLRFSYELAGAAAEVTVDVRLRSLATEDGHTSLALYADDRIFHTEEVRVGASQTAAVTVRQTWPDVRLWNIGRPELYAIRAATDADDRVDRVGFRRIETKDCRIVINGEPVYLQGVNRHEEHPEWGFAFPPKLMKKDLDIILEMGCNAVRGSHYPQSPYWLDLLDQHGIVYWSEIPIWGCFLPNETAADPIFQERALRMIDEMIDYAYHHPSVVFWSVHNEIETRTREAYEMSERLARRVREKDPSRLVAYATMQPHEDIVMPLFDVIGINKYYGWYEGDVEGFADALEKFHKHAESIGAGGKPVLMTEFGGAGIAGDVGWEPRLFSENYQAHIVTEALRIFKADPKIGGVYVWQFADVRADLRSDRGYFRDRARSFNNKGLVNEYRKPKHAFYEVRRIYRSWLE